MSRIVIYPSSNLEEILGYTALGQTLVERGHQVKLVTHAVMKKLTRAAGMEMAILESPERDIDDLIPITKALIESCKGADLLISSTEDMPGYLASEKLAIPWLNVTMEPFFMWQPVYPHEAETWRRNKEEEYRRSRETLTDAFTALGLEKEAPPWAPGCLLASHVLLACGSSFIQSDLNQFQPRASVNVTGFWLYQKPTWKDWKPSEELDRFCDRKPIVYSLPREDGEEYLRTLKIHVRAASRLGHPLLVLHNSRGAREYEIPPTGISPRGIVNSENSETNIPYDVDPKQVLFADDLPPDWLYSRAVCVIQNGNIGAIASVLRQGCPVLIEPSKTEQIYNAHLVSGLGAGVAIPPQSLEADVLVQALSQRLLTDACRERAEEIGAVIREEDGLGTACGMIERFLDRLAPGGKLPAIYERFSPPLASRSRWMVHKTVESSSVRKKSPTDLPDIPPILHQTWKDTELIPELAALQRTWLDHHPGWTYMFWTDEDNRQFLRQHYPWFLPIYDSYLHPIMRVDAVRYFILYHYGGVYVDLDFECLRPLESLLVGKEVVLGLEPEAHMTLHFSTVRSLPYLICNAFMASQPRHPFWEHVFRELIAYHQASDVLVAAGPLFLTRATLTYPQRERISIETAETLYPLTAEECREKVYNDARVREQLVQKAYAIHYWFNTWTEDASHRNLECEEVQIYEMGRHVRSTNMLQLEKEGGYYRTIGDIPLVSCLMVTNLRFEMAQRAVHCFRQQTYPNLELVIVDEGNESELKKWLCHVGDERIHYYSVKGEKKPLGELRNLSIGYARGDYVATWDDDDLSHPKRIESQMKVILGLKVSACFLEREETWQPSRRRLWFSMRRFWESSMICEKSRLPAYPPVQKTSDTTVVEHLKAHERLTLLDAPDLYIYINHGKNLWEDDHWEPQWLGATARFEGALYDVMIERIQNVFRLDLSTMIHPGQDRLQTSSTLLPAATQDQGIIPKILHQTWKDDNLPSHLVEFQRTWLENHPGWTYVLWTDEDNRKFLLQYYPWFLPIYDGYPQNIMRVDAVRYFILYHFGGLYVDLDFESLRPIGPLLASKEIVLGLEPASHVNDYVKRKGLNKIVCNALMASQSRHPFWEHIFKLLIGYHESTDTVEATGPFLLTRAVETYPFKEAFSLEAARLFYPVDKDTPWVDLDRETQKRLSQDAYAVHHWEGSWWKSTIWRLSNKAATLLLVQGIPISIAYFEIQQVLVQLHRMETVPCVSCIMVTHGPTTVVQRAILNFRSQTYPNKELVILDSDPEERLEKWIESPGDERITIVRFPEEGCPPDELRNLAMAEAKGEYLAWWDQNDMSDPQRLEVQMAVLKAFHTEACLLERHMIWNPSQKKLAVSAGRIWADSFLCEKSFMPVYANRFEGEGTSFGEHLIQRGRVAKLDMPQLYIDIFGESGNLEIDKWNILWREASDRYEGGAYDNILVDFQKHLGKDLLGGYRIGETEKEEVSQEESPGRVSRDVAKSKKVLTNRGEVEFPKILILVPVKDAVLFLPIFRENLKTLSYPHKRLRLAFLESDSQDGTYNWIDNHLIEMREEFAEVDLFKRDYAFRTVKPRWDPGLQFKRRSILARSRNYLVAKALGDEEWVLWIDVDVASWPDDVIQQLMASGKEIVTPNCLLNNTNESFDLNTFKLKPGADLLDWSIYTIDSIIQPPKGFGRLYLSDLRQNDLVELDGVGGTMLMVKADLHREGLVFPPVSYKGYIETEGLALLARDMGYGCWGMPNLEILHP